jgi:hypothetical protein
MPSIDLTELHQLTQDLKRASVLHRGGAIKVLEKVSLRLEKRIKQAMPRLSGRAKASWGHWTPGDIRFRKAAGNRPYEDASADDAVWEETSGGLTIEQGSNVPYMGRLNAGHSQQAPAGFIDTELLKAEIELEENLGLIDPLEAESWRKAMGSG